MTDFLIGVEDPSLPPDVPQNLPYPGADYKLRERIVCPNCGKRASRYRSRPPPEYLCYACHVSMRPLTSAEWVSEWRKGGVARAVVLGPTVEDPAPKRPSFLVTLLRRLTRTKGDRNE